MAIGITVSESTISLTVSSVAVATAAATAISDAGGYYTGTEVETALQEIGADFATNVTAIGLNTTHRGLTNNPHSVTPAQLGLVIGTNVLAEQSIGITDNYLLEVDGSPNSAEYARFTASGLEGRTEAEFKGDFNLEIGTDVLAFDQEVQDFADSNITVSGDDLDNVGALSMDGSLTFSGANLGIRASTGGDDLTIINLDLPDVSTQSALVRYFRNTNTSGIIDVSFYLGDGSSTVGILMRPDLGRLSLGTSTFAAGLTIDQSSSNATIPVLHLDQADTSEEFIKLVGESAADNSMSFADASDLSTPGSIVGWYQIEIEDVAASGAITDGRYWVPFYATPTT